MAKRENKQERVLVCMPADRPPGTGARIQFCQRCLWKVWVSPESLIAAGADATIICERCVQDHIDEAPPGEPIEFMPPTQRQIEMLGKRKRG